MGTEHDNSAANSRVQDGVDSETVSSQDDMRNTIGATWRGEVFDESFLRSIPCVRFRISGPSSDAHTEDWLYFDGNGWVRITRCSFPPGFSILERESFFIGRESTDPTVRGA